MKRPSVLIVANDAEFGQVLMGRWLAERDVPAFARVSQGLWNVLLSSELSDVARCAGFDLVILGPLADGFSSDLLSCLQSVTAPVIHITCDTNLLRNRRHAKPNLYLVAERDGWQDATVLLATEVLRRVATQRAARDAETAVGVSAQAASMGRFMLDARPSIIDAITTILGNAELLMLEGDRMPESAAVNAETIQTAALRLSGIMRHFSSLSAGLDYFEKSSQLETEESCNLFAPLAEEIG